MREEQEAKQSPARRAAGVTLAPSFKKMRPHGLLERVKGRNGPVPLPAREGVSG